VLIKPNIADAEVRKTIRAETLGNAQRRGNTYTHNNYCTVE